MFVRWRKVTTFGYEKYDYMGKRTISLPDEMLMELDLAVEASGRSFSGEIRFRLERLGLLMSGDVLPLDIGGDHFMADAIRYRDEKGPKFKIDVLKEDKERQTRAENRMDTVEELSGSAGAGDANRAVRVKDLGIESVKNWKFATPEPGHGIDGLVTPVPYRVREAEKNASGIPGTEIVDLGKIEVHGFGKVDAKYVIPTYKLEVTDEKYAEFLNKTGTNEKSAKKRAGTKSASVRMTKGFYQEDFASVEEAEIEAKKLGWDKGSYRIEDLVG